MKSDGVTGSANRTMGLILMAMALGLLFWHLVMYWALHAEMTWADVVQLKQKRVIGGVGMLVWGMIPWVAFIAKRGLASIARRHSARAAYKIRHRGRQIR